MREFLVLQVDILQVLGGVAPFARDLDEQPSNSAQHLFSWHFVCVTLQRMSVVYPAHSYLLQRGEPHSVTLTHLLCSGVTDVNALNDIMRELENADDDADDAGIDDFLDDFVSTAAAKVLSPCQEIFLVLRLSYDCLLQTCSMI